MTINEYADLVWYHNWHLDPAAALNEWNALTETLRQQTAMSEHSTVVGWMTPLLTEPKAGADQLNALMLFCYAHELQQSSLGNRAQNLRQAIACYDDALQVRTREKFPQDWAGIHLNKSVAMANLGDRIGALKEVELAIEGFHQVGHEHYLQMAKAWKRQFQAAINNVRRASYLAPKR